MGNRATVIFTTGDTISPATYLHWNGGPESVYAFLAELDRREIPKTADLEAARFCQVVGEFLDTDGLSLYSMNGPAEITIEALGQVQSDHGDNGFYIIDRYRDTMRRFSYRLGLPGGELVEWTPEQVATEKRLALTSSTYAGIAEHYRRRAEAHRLVDEGMRIDLEKVTIRTD